MTGYFGASRRCSSRSRSVRHTPHTETLSNSSIGAGRGTGAPTTHNVAFSFPTRCSSTARMKRLLLRPDAQQHRAVRRYVRVQPGVVASQVRLLPEVAHAGGDVLANDGAPIDVYRLVLPVAIEQRDRKRAIHKWPRVNVDAVHGRNARRFLAQRILVDGEH